MTCAKPKRVRRDNDCDKKRKAASDEGVRDPKSHEKGNEGQH
jgi:hypothetical protein